MKWETSLFQRIKRFLRDKSFPTFIYIHSPFLPFLSFFSPFFLWTNFIEIISEARGGAWSIKPWRCLTDLCYSTNLCFFAIRVTLFLLAERETSSSWLIDQRQCVRTTDRGKLVHRMHRLLRLCASRCVTRVPLPRGEKKCCNKLSIDSHQRLKRCLKEKDYYEQCSRLRDTRSVCGDKRVYNPFITLKP